MLQFTIFTQNHPNGHGPTTVHNGLKIHSNFDSAKAHKSLDGDEKRIYEFFKKAGKNHLILLPLIAI